MPEHRYDKTVADTFPASDPPANSGITGAEPPRRSERQPPTEQGTESQPTGTPTSDRHKTETAHVREDQVKTTKR
jgi:hypothetical protein